MRLGQYRTSETLSSHGPFLVCRAVDDDDNPVILKILRAEAVTPARVAMLRQGHALMCEIDHPRVAGVKSLEWVKDQPVLVMEDVGGRTLADRLAERRLSEGEALHIAVAAAEALVAIHEANIIHGDMTPANLIVGDDPDDVTVIDFGLATRGGVQVGDSSGLRGTPDYVAPELTGKVSTRSDHRADLYSFGVMVYEMLAGRKPFPQGDLLQTVHAHLAVTPARLSEHLPTAPDVLVDLVAKLLAKRPDDRYRTAAGLLVDLRYCLALVEGAPAQSDFVLAARDVPRRLVLSNALHGRDLEGSRLRALFESVRTGHSFGVTVEVTGPAGVGKTAFVEGLLHQFDRAGAMLVTARVEPSAGSHLAGAMAGAVQRGAELIITGRYGDMADWRERLTAALGDNLAPLVELAPALGRLVGDVAPPARLGPRETALRRALALRQCLRTFASGDAPLVLVVDDVQWGEPEAQELLDGLARDGGPERILLIVTRRTEGDDPAPPPRVQRVELSELSPKEIAGLLAATFRSPASEVLPLAQAIRRKVGGAPLAVRQFVGVLVDEGTLHFDDHSEAWVWDLDAVLAREAGQDLLDLLIARADRLAGADRAVLGAAACAGREFLVEEVAVAAGVPLEEAARVLERASEMDWIVPVRADEALGDGEASHRLRFSHDKVWQAATGMLTAAARRKSHERLAARIEGGSGGPPEGAALDALARHLREALADGSPAADIARARGLCAAAGAAAVQAGDRVRAHGHFRAAADLVGPGDWRDAPGEALELTAAAAGAALLHGQFAEMEARIATFFEHCPDPAARAPVQSLRVFGLMAQDKGSEAVDVALGALADLGDAMPRTVGPAEIGAEVEAVFAALATGSLETIASVPDCADPGRAGIQIMLSALMYPAFSVAPMTFAAAAARLAARSISDGLTRDSVVGINDFGILACGPLGDVDVGYGFSQQARRLIAERGLTANRARVETVFNAFVRHRKEPIRDTLGGLVESERIGLATGDVQSASLANFDRAFQIFWIGERLDAAETAFAGSAAFCEDLNVGTMPDLIRLYRETIVSLRVARESPERLTGDIADGAAMLEAYGARRDANGLVQLHIAQALLGHIFGRREAALDEARKAVGFLDGIPSTPAIPAFYALFAMIANPASRDGELAAPDLEVIEKGAEVTAEWARHAPQNYDHHASVAAAELALARGEEAEWFEKMDLAAEQASQGGFTRDAALALERIAEVSLARGRRGRYATYIQQAWRAWVHYDATAKIDQVVREHGEEIRVQASETAFSDTPAYASVSLSDDTLDLGSLLKATRAISQEVTVAALVRALLAGIVETAGAERALVVAPDGEEFRLVAEVIAQPAGPTFPVPPNIDGVRRLGPDDAPLSALRLVAWTRTALACGDVTGDVRLSGDPYFSSAPKVSAAALPLLRGDSLIGVVYLENRQVSDAFSETRLNILRALCAQAAISWDNASLYDRQARLLTASNRFVPVELFRLFNRNSITDIALGDSIERRMTILVSDMRGFSSQAERLGPELTFSVVNEFVGMISNVVRAHDGLVLKYIGDCVLAIFPGGPSGALHASIEIHGRLRERHRQSDGGFSAGIAVHSGDVMLGAVGDAERLQIDAVSDAVNAAFRIEGLTKVLGARVVVSAAAASDLGEEHPWSFRRLGDVEVDGRDRRESVLELIDAEPEELRSRKLDTRDVFDTALRLFESHEYEDASARFREVLSRNPGDMAASLLMRRAAAQLPRRRVPAE